MCVDLKEEEVLDVSLLTEEDGTCCERCRLILEEAKKAQE